MDRFTRSFNRAQRAYDNMSPPEPDEREEAVADIQERLDEVLARLQELEEAGAEEDDCDPVLGAEYGALLIEEEELKDEIQSLQSGDDYDGYDESDYEPSDYDYDRMADSYERGIYGD